MWGEFRRARAKNRGQPRRLLCQEQKPAKKFSFPFRRKNRARAKRKRRENFFAGWRASASGGGAASIVGVGFLLKKGSREVYNYSTKTNFGPVGSMLRPASRLKHRDIPATRDEGKKTKKVDYRGVCVITCGGTHIQLELEALTKLLLKKLRARSSVG